MNDKQKAAAARKLCELRGVDPKKMIPHAPKPDENGVILDVMIASSAFTLALEEIENACMLEEALKAGREI